ncbi:hypothetical protein MLD38_032933 [Melastoma candidum]|uniref:Uncharacterized protein n=1 Tax=Melastoma candidum TaxID=119954 RepID=A0ACB9M777_9MYRT|nr:hypothetical protein MLD38_032933 [Melastoma candidum]
MGKYLKKSKPTTDVSPPTSSSLLTMGVRTRAKTLALQRLCQETLPDPHSDPDLCYLQLRNRRLQKTSAPVPKGRQRKSGGQGSRPEDDDEEEEEGEDKGGYLNVSVEGSFGENDLEFDARDRSTRESTPCSFVGGSDAIPIPGSTTRRRSSISSRRITNDLLRGIPTTQEIEEFFASVEEQQRKSFIDKYNFDILNDTPLPGRYEWVEVVP